MSWQDYVDNQLTGTGHCSAGALLGVDGGVWATSKGFNVSQAEGLELAGLFKSPYTAFSSGFSLSQARYITIKANERSIYGKRGSSGVSCVNTGKVIVIGAYDEEIQPGNNAVVVERLADYLIDNGF